MMSTEYTDENRAKMGYRLNEHGEVEYVITAREKMCRRLMHFLNQRGLFRVGGYFQTEYGILHLYGGHYGWESKWVEIYDLPAEFNPGQDWLEEFPYVEVEEEINLDPVPYPFNGWRKNEDGEWESDGN